MINTKLTLSFLLIFFASVVQAEATELRINCEGDDAHASVYINGQFKGECPIDLSIAPGIVQLRVVKKLDASHDGLFENELKLAEGAVKRVNVALTSHLNAVGTLRMADMTSIPGKFVSIPGKPWKMMKYEVTFAQWDACVAAGGCNGYKPADEGWGRANRPVINVSYDDIQAYIQWLNSKFAQKFRLPTEDEWEYAARAGTTTDHWWGSTIECSQARYGRRPGGECSNTYDGTVAVGSFKASPYGLYDTAGNVWEWTTSCDEADCVNRVVRGGCWNNKPVNVAVSIRIRSYASPRVSIYGFRLVQD